MLRNSLLLVFFIANLLTAQKQLSLDYYLSDTDISYNPEIPKPQDILGYIPGEWHVTHDKLVEYMRVLANVSPRITLENRGTTYENRPLLLLTITSEQNHSNLSSIQQKHVEGVHQKLTDAIIDDMPVVVYQGFSIHGNEPSGSNAALLLAYHLAAAEGKAINELLSNVVILLDPSFNPDGLQRFASWVNANKNKNITPDSQDREYNETWPGGRTNHYWFDMNRDWLPVQLPESRARITTFHNWYPNILTDHHEMGTNSTFFFQPGIPSRTHPLTPAKNQELTREIGNYHAAALDKIGSLYYTEENFDDFYYGKGSTFPDIHGSVGILFEQASSRGHAQNSDNGTITFPFTIRNQLTAALSTLKAANSMRVSLLKYQNDFYTGLNKNNLRGYYVFGNEKDAASTNALADILDAHKIEFYNLTKSEFYNDISFKKGNSYIVPKNQRQHKLIEAIFEKRTSFKDSLFYDVSAWTLPLAFNQQYTEVFKDIKRGTKVDSVENKTTKISSASAYGYVMEWHEYYTPKALYQILNKGLRAKVGMKPFTIKNKTYDYGTVFIPVQNQKLTQSELFEFLNTLSAKNHIQIDPVTTGLTTGIDLGSSKFKPLKKPTVAMLVGEGITPYDAGEIWHLLDQRFDIPLNKIELSSIENSTLTNYSHLIIPNSKTESFTKSQEEKLTNWLKSGGTLIGFRNTAEVFNDWKLLDLNFLKPDNIAKNISFEQKDDFSGAQNIGGAIFEAQLDRSHPINFGYHTKKLALFRNTTKFIKPDRESFNNPIQYTEKPLLSGYISKKNLDSLAGTVPFVHKKVDNGRVILFTDNVNFRGFWYGTNKLMMNAIFFDKAM
ncbi:M14 family metallopeptidase [Aquimarina intermedia]|uniref:Zinc carboxypeptidase n=1 Tax=Aquimarina intermedia TaxID=350814 RepID=A0A5S5C3N4_9FLAO|nr:M14 family metallopeptidase [Aquimarina intermedia]TYP72930.1 zinc carboxypeptidase [Aquimarina intermedia]